MAGRAGPLRTGARELRLVSRYRRKSGALCASELDRLHKVLDDGGIKLGAVVADVNGVSVHAMVKGLIGLGRAVSGRQCASANPAARARTTRFDSSR